MDKAEVLRVAVRLRTTYQTLKGCAEGRDERYRDFKYIPLNLPFAPTEEQIKGLADYILENEDEGLYSKTFGMMDMELLNSIYWKLNQAQWGWSGDIKYNLSIGNKAEVRKLNDEDFLYIVEVYDNWKMLGAILGENRLLQPIFKNLIPQQSKAESKNSMPEEDAPAQSNIFEYMRTTKKKRLKDTLHKYIDGKTGRAAILPLYVAVNLKLMDKPKYNDFIEEFGSIIKESEYSKAMNRPKFDPTTVEKMERIFTPLKQ